MRIVRGKTLGAANGALQATGFKPGTRGVVPLGWQVGLMVSE
jgi:hypothetical protein